MTPKKLAFGGLVLSSGLALIISATPAWAVTTASVTATSTHSFKVDTMTTNNPAFVASNNTAGDDGGFLAVTPDVLLRDGDDEVYAFNKTTLDAVGGGLTSSNSNSLFSDLTSETAYEFIFQNSEGYTGAYELDEDGNRTATELTFSETIPTENGDVWVAASGAGQVAFWNGSAGEIWVVSLPSGTITKVTGKSTFGAYDFAPKNNREGTSSLFQAGVLEYDCSNYEFLLIDSETESIARYDSSTSAREVVLPEEAANTSNADSDAIMVSPGSARWYAHTEFGMASAFGIDMGDGLSDEPIVSGDATFTSEANCGGSALPDTGVSEYAGIWAASAALVAGLGFAGIFMSRRRHTNLG